MCQPHTFCTFFSDLLSCSFCLFSAAFISPPMYLDCQYKHKSYSIIAARLNCAALTFLGNHSNVTLRVRSMESYLIPRADILLECMDQFGKLLFLYASLQGAWSFLVTIYEKSPAL